MYTFGESYGFWLTPSVNTTDKVYSEIMRDISYICEETEAFAQSLKLPYEVFAFPLKTSDDEKKYLSVCIFKSVALFGIFDKNTNRLFHEYYCDDLLALTPELAKAFVRRNENFLIQKRKTGKTKTQVSGLLSAWIKYIFENQNHINKVILANKDKRILIKKPDAPDGGSPPPPPPPI